MCGSDETGSVSDDEIEFSVHAGVHSAGHSVEGCVEQKNNSSLLEAVTAYHFKLQKDCDIDPHQSEDRDAWSASSLRVAFSPVCAGGSTSGASSLVQSSVGEGSTVPSSGAQSSSGESALMDELSDAVIGRCLFTRTPQGSCTGAFPTRVQGVELCMPPSLFLFSFHCLYSVRKSTNVWAEYSATMQEV